MLISIYKYDKMTSSILDLGLLYREIYKSAKAQILRHYESAKKQLCKRNSDRYREPQQRFTKPQTGLYTIRAMYSIFIEPRIITQ